MFYNDYFLLLNHWKFLFTVINFHFPILYLKTLSCFYVCASDCCSSNAVVLSFLVPHYQHWSLQAFPLAVFYFLRPRKREIPFQIVSFRSWCRNVTAILYSRWQQCPSELDWLECRFSGVHEVCSGHRLRGLSIPRVFIERGQGRVQHLHHRGGDQLHSDVRRLWHHQLCSRPAAGQLRQEVNPVLRCPSRSSG